MKLVIRCLFMFSNIGICLLALSGCATLTGSTKQNIAVEAYNKEGKKLNNVYCCLTNDKGTWHTTTPNSVTIQKSAEDLKIVCEKSNLKQGIVKTPSKLGPEMIGNLIIPGGSIGALIDHKNGSAYQYPSIVKVIMGETQFYQPSKT